MIKPSIGRVVWYTPSKADFQLANTSSQPLAALVAFVHGDECVNLAVFDANGGHHSRCSVQLVQDEVPAFYLEHGGYAEWMPYQKGQAAKTETLEAAKSEPE
jgi:hypothetical protein